MKILLADDRKDVLDAIKDFLEVMGHEVTTFKEPNSVLLSLDAGVRPDAIITDQDFGINWMRGDGLIRLIRERGHNTPIILFSGESLKILKERTQGLANVTIIGADIEELLEALISIRLDISSIHET